MEVDLYRNRCNTTLVLILHLGTRIERVKLIEILYWIWFKWWKTYCYIALGNRWLRMSLLNSTLKFLFAVSVSIYRDLKLLLQLWVARYDAIVLADGRESKTADVPLVLEFYSGFLFFYEETETHKILELNSSLGIGFCMLPFSFYGLGWL